MATPKTLTTEECEKLLLALRWKKEAPRTDKKHIRNYTMALLMLDAGLRVGEVVQMKFYHLYFSCLPVTSIIIPAEIAKNKTERTIPVSERLSNALKNHRPHIETQFIKIETSFVFHKGVARWPLTTRQVERIIKAAAMKALGHPVHPHVLRHTFASRLMRTTSIRVVQELLGHKNLSSTQIYTHPNHDDLKSAIDTLDTNQPFKEVSGNLSIRDPNTPNSPDTTRTDRHM